VELLVGLLLRRPGDDEVLLLALDGHVRVELAGQLALRPGDREDPPVDRHVDAGRYGDWEATDT